MAHERSFFELLDDMHIRGRWHLGSTRFADGAIDEEPRLVAGIPVSPPRPLTVDIHRAGRALDFSLTGVAEPVVTARLAEAIEEVAHSDIQRLPVSIEGATGGGSYEALNAVRVVDCLDEERSEFIKWTSTDGRPDRVGRYRQVTRLFVDKARIPANCHVFRLLGWAVALVVSDEVRSAMLAAGCRGAKFAAL